MNRFELKKIRRARRKMSIRKDIYGTTEKPRLSIFRSLNNIFVQLIDDTNGNVVLSASTIDKEVKTKITDKMTKIDQSKLIGKIIAERAIAQNIKEAIFDRNGYIYHGRVKALADAARESGLKL